jgi:large repetitive protein
LVNNAPEIISASGVLTVDERNTLTTPDSSLLTITSVSIIDTDAGAAPIEVTLSVSNGTAANVGDVTLAVVGGLTFSSGANGSNTMTFTGTLVDINNALNGMTFKATDDFDGPVALTLSVDDQGNSPGPINMVGTGSIDIMVNAVNDPPEFAITGVAPFQVGVNEDAGAQNVFGFVDPNSISAGAPNEDDPNSNSFQTLMFEVAPVVGQTTGNLMFTTAPQIDSATGNLTFEAAANKNGSAVFSAVLRDSGVAQSAGPNDPNRNESVTRFFTINVNAVNDVPSFTAGGNQLITEDSGLVIDADWATNVIPGPAAATDEGNQTLTFNFQLIPGASTPGFAFASQPQVTFSGTSWDLSYETAADINGRAVFNVSVSDDGLPVNETSPSQRLTIAVTPVNDRPEFTIAGTSQTVPEDVDIANVPSGIGFINGIRPGPVTAVDETNSQPVAFTLSYITTALQVPALGTNPGGIVDGDEIVISEGTDTFRFAFDLNNTPTAGAIPVTVAVNASQATVATALANAIGGTPGIQMRPLAIANGLVRFTEGVRHTIDVSNSVVTVPAAFQGLLDAGDFAIPPALTDRNNGTADLAYLPSADVNGNAIVVIELMDQDNNLPRVDQTSIPQSFTITVNPINDAPTFTNGGNVTVTERDPLGTTPTQAGWATPIMKGPADEAGQTLTFTTAVSITAGNLAFDVAPAIDPITGDLTFQPVADTSGTATVVVSLVDDGVSSPAPNDNTANDETLTISVTSENDAPIVLNPIADVSVDEDAANTEIELFPSVFGDVDLNPVENDVLTITMTSSDPSLVMISPASNGIINVGTTSLVRSLVYMPNQNGTATITVTATDLAGTSVTDTFDVTVGAVNDDPTITAPVAARVPEGTDTALVAFTDVVMPSLSGVVVDDVDVLDTPAADITVTLAVTQGTLSVRSDIVGGVGPTNILANNNSTVSFRGTPAELAATLDAADGVLYQPSAFYNGPVTLVVTANDGGATGTGGGANVNETIAITVTELNDAPIAIDDTRTTPEDVPLVFNASSLRVNDLTAPAGAVDEAGQNLTVSLPATQPSGADVTLVSGELTFTPPQDEIGDFTFTYIVTDDGTDDGVVAPRSDTGTVTVTVTSVNDAPITADDAVTSNEDQILVLAAVSLLANDSAGPADEANQIMTVTGVSSTSAQGGSVFFDSMSGTITYTPPQDYFGPDSFTYDVVDDGTSDGMLDPQASVGTVSLTIDPVNDPPIAGDDTRPTLEEVPITFDSTILTGNDSPGIPANESAQALSVIAVNRAPNTTGTVSLSNGQITYTPAMDFNGTDIFTYTLSDGGATNSTTTGTVTVNVAAVNDQPTANDDLAGTAEDTSIQIAPSALLTNDDRGPANESSQVLTIAAVSSTSTNGGSVAIELSGQIRYTPRADFSGTDTFTYTVTDDGLTNGQSDPLTDEGTVTVTVTAANDAPVTVDDRPFLGIGNSVPMEDTTFLLQASTLLLNDRPGPIGQGVDNELGQTLTITGVNQPLANGGSVVLTGNTIAFTPPLNANGELSFTYTVEDNGTTNGIADPMTSEGTVRIFFRAVNDTPVMSPSQTSTPEDTQLQVPSSALTANDLPGPVDEISQTLSVLSVSNASARGGVVSLSSGIATYTPPMNFSGIDTFTYTVLDNGLTDGQLDERSNIGTYTVNVTPVNDPPIAVNDAFAATDEDTILSTQGAGVLANDFDIDLPADTMTVFGAPLNVISTEGAGVTIQADGTFVYDQTNAAGIQALFPGQSLTDTFRYQVTDGQLDLFGQPVVSNFATVSILVVGANDAPVAFDDTFTVNEDAQLTVGLGNSILLNDTDAEPGNAIDVLSAILVSGPTNGSLNLNLNGTFTYTPTPNFAGSDTFSYRASDGSANSDVATVTIDVTAQNDPPTGNADTYSTDNATQLIVDVADGVLANDTDQDQDTQTTPLTARVVSAPANSSSFSLNTDGSFQYTPAIGFSGLDRFTYEALDQDGAVSAVTAVDITVSPSSTFQNPRNPRDVNDDGVVSPIDALLLINYINANGTHTLTDPLPGIPFPDTNGDGSISPVDPLGVINELNAQSNGEGESVVQIEATELFEGPLLPNVGTQSIYGPSTDNSVDSVFGDSQQSDDDTSTEDFFADLGRSDFARQQQAMTSSARASLAAKASELEAALDSLFDDGSDEELL